LLLDNHSNVNHLFIQHHKCNNTDNNNIALQDYYEVAWSEGQNSTKPPIYAPFLTTCGKDNVKVSPWEEGQFTNEWCQQSYTHQRRITFQFMKQTIGQTLVEVQHTQRMIRDKDDRCIVQITMEMKGFPYADCFVVEVRHVASRHGKSDLVLEVGMYVRFVKGCLFEGKIRNNTGNETSKAQCELLCRIVEGCREYAILVEEDNEEDIDMEQEMESKSLSKNAIPEVNGRTPADNHQTTELMEANTALRTLLLVLAALFQKYVQPYVPYKYKPIQPSTVNEVLQDVRERIVVLRDVSFKSVREEDREEVRNEILAIEESLCKIEQMNVSNSI
jgi:hypothetical protein